MGAPQNSVSPHFRSFAALKFVVPVTKVRSDSLAVLLDRIAVQAPHLLTTQGAMTFVISQVNGGGIRKDRFVLRINGVSVLGIAAFWLATTCCNIFWRLSFVVI